MRETDVITYSRAELIDEMALLFKDTISKADIVRLLNTLERNILWHLQEADPDHSIVVRPFLGLQLTSWFEESKDIKVMGEKTTLPHMVKAKARMTKYFKDKVNRHYR